MPFTFAHPAAILPIHSAAGPRLPLSALVIGSMIPDFAYFFPFLTRESSHSISGFFLFCVPAGVAVWVLHERWLRRPLTALLPFGWAGRLARARDVSPPPVTVAAIAAVAVGAISHLGWDAFTHPGAPGVRLVPWLDTLLFTIAGVQVRGYRVLQHASTASGLAVLALAVVRWQRRAPSADRMVRGGPERGLGWTVIAAATVVGAVVGFIPASSLARDLAGFQQMTFFTTIHAMSGLGTGILAHALLWHVREQVVTRPSRR